MAPSTIPSLESESPMGNFRFLIRRPVVDGRHGTRAALWRHGFPLPPSSPLRDGGNDLGLVGRGGGQQSLEWGFPSSLMEPHDRAEGREYHSTFGGPKGNIVDFRLHGLQLFRGGGSSHGLVGVGGEQEPLGSDSFSAVVDPYSHKEGSECHTIIGDRHSNPPLPPSLPHYGRDDGCGSGGGQQQCWGLGSSSTIPGLAEEGILKVVAAGDHPDVFHGHQLEGGGNNHVQLPLRSGPSFAIDFPTRKGLEGGCHKRAAVTIVDPLNISEVISEKEVPKVIIIEDSDDDGVEKATPLAIGGASGIRAHECLEYSMTFSCALLLNSHMATHKNSETRVSTKLQDRKGLCSSTYRGWQKGRRQYVCRKCGKAFSTGQALGGHMRYHNSGQPHSGMRGDGEPSRWAASASASTYLSRSTTVPSNVAVVQGPATPPIGLSLLSVAGNNNPSASTIPMKEDKVKLSVRTLLPCDSEGFRLFGTDIVEAPKNKPM